MIRAKQNPWVDIVKFHRLCEEYNIEITKGERHNRTDGEVHYILTRNNQEYILHANRWDYRQAAWQRAANWMFNY